MKVNEDLYLLPIDVSVGDWKSVLNLSLIVDPVHGSVLVDTAIPNKAEAIGEALKEAGLTLGDVRHVVITHQDVDHIGSLGAVKKATGADVYAHSVEIPYIDGRTRMVKYPSPEVLAQNPTRKALFENLEFVPVEHAVEDGQVLDFAGGVRVIFTPGHTPGHISLFLERSKVLITGDAMVSADGKLTGLNEPATPDLPTAYASIRKMAEELPEISAILCYHGGLVTDDPVGQLRGVAGAVRG